MRPFVAAAGAELLVLPEVVNNTAVVVGPNGSVLAERDLALIGNHLDDLRRPAATSFPHRR